MKLTSYVKVVRVKNGFRKLDKKIVHCEQGDLLSWFIFLILLGSLGTVLYSYEGSSSNRTLKVVQNGNKYNLLSSSFKEPRPKGSAKLTINGRYFARKAVYIKEEDYLFNWNSSVFVRRKNLCNDSKSHFEDCVLDYEMKARSQFVKKTCHKFNVTRTLPHKFDPKKKLLVLKYRD